ncbi:MAG: tRNA 4-thiouridine(8) synthase ThiI, partial [bacterium]
SGCAEILLRPLSAKLLSPTRPEQEGLVDRERLLAIEGRSRRPQMELAKKYGITQYMQPAGGCLLTDPAFSARLAELMRNEPDFTADDVSLLKLGRHFRLPSGAKLIVGRNERDNAKIEIANDGHILIAPEIIPGPTALLIRSRDKADIDLALRICASYSDHEEREVELALSDGTQRKLIKSQPSLRGEFDSLRI